MAKTNKRARRRPRAQSRRTSPQRALRLLSDWVAQQPEWERRSEFDGFVRATFARATKTYRAGMLLTRAGFGPQAAMLCRSLFEDMVVAYWAVYARDETWVVQRLQDQSDHERLLLDRTVTTHRAIFGESEDLVLRDREALLTEKARFEALFGEHGGGFWWARDIEPVDPPKKNRPYRTTATRSLNSLVNEIGSLPQLKEHWHSSLGPDVTSEEADGRPTFLRAMFDVAQRYSNTLLHHTVYALDQTMPDGEWDDDRSDEWVSEVQLFLYWTFGQLILLMCDRFSASAREDFVPLFHSTATAAFHPSPHAPSAT